MTELLSDAAGERQRLSRRHLDVGDVEDDRSVCWSRGKDTSDTRHDAQTPTHSTNSSITQKICLEAAPYCHYLPETAANDNTIAIAFNKAMMMGTSLQLWRCLGLYILRRWSRSEDVIARIAVTNEIKCLFCTDSLIKGGEPYQQQMEFYSLCVLVPVVLMTVSSL